MIVVEEKITKIRYSWDLLNSPFFLQGCYDALYDLIQKYSIYYIVVGVTVLVIEVGILNMQGEYAVILQGEYTVILQGEYGVILQGEYAVILTWKRMFAPTVHCLWIAVSAKFIWTSDLPTFLWKVRTGPDCPVCSWFYWILFICSWILKLLESLR